MPLLAFASTLTAVCSLATASPAAAEAARLGSPAIAGASHHIEGATLDTARAGDVRIISADSGIDMALIGDSISSGLSQRSIAKVRRETDTTKASNTGLGASLENLVKRTVQGAVGTRMTFPLSAFRDVSYENNAIVFDWVDKQHNALDGAKINGKRVLESFAPDEARRFVAAVKARKALQK